MIRTYTEAEMLRIWKNKCGLIEASAGGVVTRQDGSNLDTYFIGEIRAWYADVLRNADIELLPVENLADEVTKAAYVDTATAEITFPDRGIRLVAVRMNEWKQEITCFYSPDSDMARLQRTELLRASPTSPVVILDKRKLILYGVEVPTFQLDPSAGATSTVIGGLNYDAFPAIKTLRMVARPTDDTYTFDDSLLSTIH